MTNVVIVGAGQAGAQVAASLREEGFDGAITLIGSEEHPPYQRPPLSKAHLTGSPREKLFLRGEAWFTEQRIELRLGEHVEEIDRSARKLRLRTGEQVGYDVLVLALGARNRELSLPGRQLSGVLGLRTLAEADQIKQRLDEATNVVVIGGGFIGLEVAAIAAAAGRTTTVLELAPRLMGRVLSETCAAFLLDAHRRRGVIVEPGVSARALLGPDGHVSAVETTDGRTIKADLVLVGVGAVAESELAAAAGLAVEDGIVVDEFLRTSDPAVYAVGDCARGPNPYAGGQLTRLESVQNAVDQARCAARTIAGRSEAYDAVPWFWSDQGDLKLQIAGLTQGHDQVVILGSLEEQSFSVWCFTDGRLVGVETVNRVKDHLGARKLLAAGIDVSPETVVAKGFSPKDLLAK